MSQSRFSKNWYYLGKWNEFPVDSDIWFNRRFRKEFKKLFNVPIKSLVITKHCQSTQYFCQEDINLIKKEFFGLTYSNPKKLIKILKSFDKVIKKAKDFLKEYQGKEISKSLGKRFYKRFLQTKAQATAIDWYSFLIEHWLENKILKSLNRINFGSLKNTSSILGALITPHYTPESLKEALAIKRAALNSYHSKKQREKLSKRLAKRFGYLMVFHHREPKTNKEYFNELNTLIKKTTKTQLKKIIDKSLEEHKKFLQKQTKFFEKIKKDINLYNQVLILQQAATVRTKNDELVSLLSDRLNEIMNTLLSKVGLNKHDWHFLLPEEIFAILDNKKVPWKKIEQRKKWYVAITTNNNEDYRIEGKRAKKMVNKINLSSIKKKVLFKKGETIKGQTAFPGKIKGKVRVFKKSFHKFFKDKEILVTKMTTVDYLPYMRRAAAIITDEGGVTSHAAIVSRELNIPCVIGTKIATKVLKDGDLVEVDADKGIIRLIKKTKKNEQIIRNIEKHYKTP